MNITRNGAALLGLAILAACSSSTPPSSDAGAADAGDAGASSDSGANAGPCDGLAGPHKVFDAQASEDEIATELVNASAGETICFLPGRYAFTNTLSLMQARVTVKGSGIDQTVFDFKGQLVGSEGILAQSSDELVLEDFSIRDTPGNAIKVLGSTTATFRNLKVEWTAPDGHTHGAYGLYPVQSKNILIEGSTVIGASDSGIYVGQSTRIIVRNNTVQKNVAGIEIENSSYADVLMNVVEDNTAGILVFALPDLPVQGTHDVRVFQNTVRNNNRPNFAAAGDIVSLVPAGAGIVVVAASGVEVSANNLTEEQTVALAAVSFLATQVPIRDPRYYPYPSKVHFHDNTVAHAGTAADRTVALGALLRTATVAFEGHHVPDIVWDGVFDLQATGPNPGNPMTVCVGAQYRSTFADLRLWGLDMAQDNLAMVLSTTVTPFLCTLPPLAPVTLGN